ncbi:DNA polymerase III subunit gamma/tau [Candidatus Berkelbacteria bacterium CG10_big_fil_rev_8_21_14_0_10_41_12]|uniref:DNA polymerase III subunit gamma/tau n=1 Tax=Candidatus Berkelbacteria bacterium CG10_big_fil_rev_8_21_14_0_10_41_12 TaxID=1974513 RepID=A0A2M6WWJ2_9BACT|nr:MAG: DNA polymerase III subunit gamma/tau [Candidatus Berkelbacteria bacterium CG10_big_fil_rev_8_21_14_0_10_41_12]
MSSLYRTYRPQLFSQVVGQDHVTKTLLAALKEGKIGHAYLFTGPRGIGKTTVARLLAKALNCTGKNKPCGVCGNCKDIAVGKFIDLIEIDAASNRGIDEIRELRDKINFSPNVGAKKVYIIDEVHMLTKEAFNALLKTLEEPPAHSVFILATTEIHKVMPTVISRCQRFDFKQASIDNLISLIKRVAKEEKIDLKEDQIRLIAKRAEGSYRDALSILDQISSVANKSDLTEALNYLLGLADAGLVKDFIWSIKNTDVKKSFAIITIVFEKGMNFDYFLRSLIGELRKEMITLVTSGQDTLWYIEALSELLEAQRQISWTSSPSLPLEIAVLKIAGNQDDVSARVDSLGKSDNLITDGSKYDNANQVKKVKANAEVERNKNKKVDISDRKKNSTTPRSVGAAAADKEKKIVLDAEAMRTTFIEALSGKNKSLATIVAGASWKSSPGSLNLQVEFNFHKDQITKQKSITLIRNTLRECFGRCFEVNCEVVGSDVENNIGEVFGIAD